MDEWLEAPSARCLSVHLKKHLVRRLESDSGLGFRRVTTIGEPVGEKNSQQTEGMFSLSDLCVLECVKAAMQLT